MLAYITEKRTLTKCIYCANAAQSHEYCNVPVLLNSSSISMIAFLALHLPFLVIAATTLSRLATVCPPALNSVSAHRLPKCDVHSWWRRETKALGDTGQVQLIHVIYGSQTVTGVGVEVGFEGVLGALLQVVVLADELLELRLDIDDLLGRELELDNGNSCRLEVREEADLVGLKEQETAALGVGASGGTADAVDVVAGVVGRIKLDNEVDRGNLVKLLDGLSQTLLRTTAPLRKYSHQVLALRHPCRSKYHARRC